jgi:ABC-type multidrug transport system fused ATPase/permease subunit
MHFLGNILLIFGNSVILGGALSVVLPVINLLFSTNGESVGIGGGYFGKVLSLYKQLLPESEYKKIISLSILFIMMMINTGVQYIIVKANSGLTTKLIFDCRKRIYNNIQHMKFPVLGRYPRGMLVQLLITEVRGVYAVFKQVFAVIATSFNIIVIIALLFLLSWKLSIVLLIGGFLIILINLNIVKGIKQLGKIALNHRERLMNQTTEAIWGIKQSRLMQAEAIINEKLADASRHSENTAHHLMIKNGFQVFLSQNLTIGVILIIILFWLFSPVFSEGISTTAGIVTFMILIGRLSPSVGVISKEYGTIFSYLPSIKRVNEFLSDKVELESDGSYEPPSFFADKICLHNIYFEYPSEKPVLCGINLEIKRGSYIGIIGRSGQGKSTMLSLFTRIYDPTKGELFIDGVNIREFKLSYLRSHIGMISQDFFLFNTTIKENLFMAKPSAVEQDLWMALEKAGLYDFVNSLDEKLEASVGENGNKLSEGQRQRLCLSAIFLQNPDLIILDEGTSSVDKETESHILSSLRDLHCKGKTIISVSHKETALSDAESVYQLIDGELKLVDEKIPAKA